VTPLSTALGLPVNDRFADNDADITKMTDAILHDVTFAGKIVLICWHHGKIPDVAKLWALRSRRNGTARCFDRVWQITFPKGKATLADLPQMLLYGDSDK
jgi:hypothetical protein